MSAHAELLRKKYAKLTESGVEDIKFVFGPLSERSTDDVCASINQVLDAVEREEYSDFPAVGDSRRKA